MVDTGELKHAVIGAVVTIALSFTGFSALLGGGIAGYLEFVPPKRGARVGAISGVIASLPILLVLFFGLVVGTVMPRYVGVTNVAGLAFILLLLFPLLIGWIVGLSAVGGYLGAYLRWDTARRQPEPATPEQG